MERKLEELGDKTLSSNMDIGDAEDIMLQARPRPWVRGRKEESMSREEMQNEGKCIQHPTRVLTMHEARLP